MKRGVKINCNVGTMKTNQQGDYRRISVWFIPKGIANIFLINELEKKYRITCDSWEGYYVVHTPNGPVKFYKIKNGLPYINLEDSEEDAVALLMQTGSEEAATVFVQTVHQNYEGFTKEEILHAKEARRAMGLAGNPRENNFKGMASNNMIKNCPITTTAITNACNFFGLDLASVRESTVQRAPAPVVGDYVAVPRGIVERNKIVTFVADVFFVDGIAFLLMVSRNIKFITAEHVATRTAKSLSRHLEHVIQVYTQAGFNLRTILMGRECEKVKDMLPLVMCITTTAK